MRGSLMPLGVLLVSSTWRLFLPAVTGKESVIRRMKSVRELKAVKELSSSYNSKVCEENTVINSLIITSQGGWVDSLNKAAGNWGILGNLLRILQIFITGKTSIKVYVFSETFKDQQFLWKSCACLKVNPVGHDVYLMSLNCSSLTDSCLCL